MKSNIKKIAETFVKYGDAVDEKLNSNKGCHSATFCKIGVFLGSNPITGPIIVPAALTYCSFYATYKVTKKIIEKK